MRGTMSYMAFLSTPGQVTPRQNAQCNQSSNSSDSLCLQWSSTSLNKLLSLIYEFLRETFEIFNPCDLCARSLNDSDLLNSKPLKSTAFPNHRAQQQQNQHFSRIDLVIKRCTQGHNLNNLDSTRIPDATYQVSRPTLIWFWRKRFLKVLSHIGMGDMP